MIFYRILVVHHLFPLPPPPIQMMTDTVTFSHLRPTNDLKPIIATAAVVLVGHP